MRITTVPRTVKLAAAAFELQKAGLIFGWVFAAQQLGRATAANGAGFARTLLLTYSPALYSAGAACLLAAAMVMMIRRPRRADRSTEDCAGGCMRPRPKCPLAKSVASLQSRLPGDAVLSYRAPNPPL